MNDELLKIRKKYFDLLVDEELPFWLNHGLDKINGGIYTGLDEDGTIIETDKSVWFQGRALWVFCNAYKYFGQKKEYLEAADSLVKFIDDHCFDTDGRMFFRVSADGKPVIKRLRYFFSETFAIIGYCSYYCITGKQEYKDKAFKLFEFVMKLKESDGILIPKFNQETEPSIAFGGPMILLNVLSEMRKAFPEKEDWINSYMAKLLDEVEKYFVRDDMQLVLEQCAPDGTFMKDHYEGRLLNPGHAIEASWFIMNEGITTNNERLKKLGLKILDWEWKLGWDEEFGGGIIQYRDALNLPLSEYHQDMKFWWPQCEAAIANLLAYSITDDKKYLDNFYRTDAYIFERFHDAKYGEWYGYFHRDGSLATRIKGNMYKGPFHIPRMYMKCVEIIDTIV